MQAVLRVQQHCRQLAAQSAGLGLAALVACTGEPWNAHLLWLCHAGASAGCLKLQHIFAAGPALAIDKVGSFEASGLIFKDSVEVIAQEDPAGS